MTVARPLWEWPQALRDRFEDRPSFGQPESLPRAMLVVWAYVLLAAVLSAALIGGLHAVGLWDGYAALVTDLYWFIPGIGWFLGAMFGDALPWFLPFLLWLKVLSPDGED